MRTSTRTQPEARLAQRHRRPSAPSARIRRLQGTATERDQAAPSSSSSVCSSSGRSSSSSSSTASTSRRELLLRSVSLGPAVALGAGLIGTDDPTTIVNSILSGYGLPMLKQDDANFKVYDEFENDWVLSYPRSWVARDNTLRGGWVASNFQTADKVTVESFTVSPGEDDKELVRRAVAAAVVPGGAEQQSDKLLLPAERLIKTEAQVVDSQRYIYITFPSETITRSGYAIKRKHFAVVAVVPRRNVAYTASASARSDQYNDKKADVLRRIVASFRVRG